MAIPLMEGDEPYEEAVCRALFQLSHPFVDAPGAVAPTKPYQFVLTRDEILEISRLH